MSISAEHGRGIYELWEYLHANNEENEDDDLDEGNGDRIAILGRPNVGKSTLVNRLIGEENMLFTTAREQPWMRSLCD